VIIYNGWPGPMRLTNPARPMIGPRDMTWGGPGRHPYSVLLENSDRFLVRSSGADIMPSACQHHK
jgi:hypothetical protein